MSEPESAFTRCKGFQPTAVLLPLRLQVTVELVGAMKVNEQSRVNLTHRLDIKKREHEMERRVKTFQNTQLLGQITELRHYNRVLSAQLEQSQKEAQGMAGRSQRHVSFAASGGTQVGHQPFAGNVEYGYDDDGEDYEPYEPYSVEHSFGKISSTSTTPRNRNAMSMPAGRSAPPLVVPQSAGPYTMSPMRGASNARPTSAGGVGLGVLSNKERKALPRKKAGA